MPTQYSTNLKLALPVQGELSGQWGNVVNYAITDYVDIAIAGTLTLDGDGAVTLDRSTGDQTSPNFTSTTAQYAVLRVTGTLTTTKVITAPAYSKVYVVDNAATGGSVTIKASGQTGVSVAVGEKVVVYYNGTDYVRIATSIPNMAAVTGTLPIANGGTNATTAASALSNLGGITTGKSIAMSLIFGF